MTLPEATMTEAEKRASSSSLRFMALIRSAKSNIESRRKPALLLACNTVNSIYNDLHHACNTVNNITTTCATPVTP